MRRTYRVGFYVYHGWRYWKTDGLEAGEVLGWNTRYLPYFITRITPKRIVCFWESGSDAIHEVQLNREVMERDGKQYHTRFHEYFYATKPKPNSKEWNWAGSDPNFTSPTFAQVFGDSAAAKVLGISHPYTTADVKRAYKRLALKTHPDLGGSNADFIKLKQAHDSALRFAQPST